jgi:hypothetical protein
MHVAESVDEIARCKIQRVERNEARPTGVAIIYAGLNDRGRAFAWLEPAYAQHAQGVIYLKAQPFFDNLRSDRR